MSSDLERKSTPKDGGYEITRFNAVRHGVLSKYTVLPWEDPEEYEILLKALVGEHQPQGPTEEHLVEEVAGVIWRKRRLRLGERAAHSRALQRITDPDQYPLATKAALVVVTSDFKGHVTGETIIPDKDQGMAARERLKDNIARAKKALAILATKKTEEAYLDAIYTLTDEEQEKWRMATHNTNAPFYFATAEGLMRFLKVDTLPRYRDRQYELEHRSLIRDQVFGQAVNTSALEGLAGYEVHLDRKLERTLAMLLKLKMLRQDTDVDKADGGSQIEHVEPS
jgi:hypothetical protein